MTAPDPRAWAVIMAGGSGTRFWPLSRGHRPKQLLRIVGETTMIQATVARLQPLIPPERVLVITTAALAEATRHQLPMLRPGHVIAEPVARDTAACACLAALVVERLAPGAPLVTLPADHVISPADGFQAALRAGIARAEAGDLVTYGIAPRGPATGYGYIQLGAELPAADGVRAHRARRFVEKPDRATAEGYLAAGDYRWNGGIFTWRSDVVLAAFARHCPWLAEALAPVGAAWGTPGFDQVLAGAYGPLKKISVDYALMERAEAIAVITGDFAWDDVGSWDALYDHLPVDGDGVVARGEAVAIGCRDSLFVNESGQTLVGIGLDGLTVVATPDAVLVVPKGRSQEVKQVVERLQAEGKRHLL